MIIEVEAWDGKSAINGRGADFLTARFLKENGSAERFLVRLDGELHAVEHADRTAEEWEQVYRERFVVSEAEDETGGVGDEHAEGHGGDEGGGADADDAEGYGADEDGGGGA